MCILYKKTCLFKYKNKLILFPLRLFLCCKHGKEIRGKKIHIAFRLHWDAYLTSHHCVVDRMIFH